MFSIRDMAPGDEALIFSTWLSGLYYGDSWFSLIEKDAFFKNYHLVIERLLSKCQVKVACLADDPDVIIGYAVFHDNFLDWVYVKKAWRKLGVARSLVPSGLKGCTHLSKVGASLKPTDWVFNPFAI